MSDKSPSQAMTRAIERTRELLFPARMEKWLALGFIAFLAGLGEGGGSYNYRFPFPGGSGSGGAGKGTPTDKAFADIWRQALAFIQAHLTLVIAGASGVVLFAFALGLVLTWLSSRGKLMFVEAVVHDRYQVKEPWKRLREPAWVVFKFRVALGLVMLLATLLALGAGALVAFDELRTGHFGAKSAIGFAASAGVVSVTLVPLALVSAFLEDFVLPVFYLRGGTLRGAWATVRSDVLASNAGAVFLFYLLKALLFVGFMLLSVLTACLTCCIAALPYLSSVALLPGHVFFRAYSLYFLEELGISVFPPKPPVTESYAHYPQRFGS
jgi:hypothetical protein